MKVIVAWAFLPAASAFLPTSGPRGGTSRTGGVALTIEMTAGVDAPSPGAGNGPRTQPQQHFRNTSQYFHFGPRCDSDPSGSTCASARSKSLARTEGWELSTTSGNRGRHTAICLFREAAPARFACPLTSVLCRRPDNFSSGGAWCAAGRPRIEFSNRLHIAYRLV